MTISPAVEEGLISCSAESLHQSFVDAYQENFGGNLETSTEIVSVRATLRQSLPPRAYADERAVHHGGGDQHNVRLEAGHSTDRVTWAGARAPPLH